MILRFFTLFRRLVSLSVLLVVYLGVVAPVGLVLGLVRGDPLQRGFEPERASYWEDREPEVDPGPSAHPEWWTFGLARDKLWLLPVVAVLLSVGMMVAVTEGSVWLAFLYPLF